MKRLLILMIVWVLALPAAAQDADLRRLDTADDAKAWDAVGRLNIGRRSFCTGALIAEDLVLTAAHCLYRRGEGTREKLEEFQFLAGWRDGRARAYRGVKRAVVHPNYRYDSSSSGVRVSYDVALLELDRPIRLPDMTPFETAAHPRKGDEVGVVSYARNRSDAPSLQELCHVMARRPGVLMLSCDVDFGSSGSPVFTFDGDEARIVSVVSAMSDVDEKKVALGAGVSKSLDLLKLRLAEGQGVWTRSRTTGTGFGNGGARSGGGAKFVKP